MTKPRWTIRDTAAVGVLNLAEHLKRAAGVSLDRIGVNIDRWLENLQIGYLPSPLCILCDRFADGGDLCERCKGILRDGLGIPAPVTVATLPDDMRPVAEPQITKPATITAQTFAQWSSCGCYIPPGATRPIHRTICHLTTKETP